MSIGVHACNYIWDYILSAGAHYCHTKFLVSLYQSEMVYNRKDLFWVILARLPYPILAQNTSFQGDEFSNNLFSDLGKLYNLISE